MIPHWHYQEKEFHDSADDIEGVNIHYVLTPLSGEADWDNQRTTRFMPLVQPRTFPRRDTSSPSPESADPPSPGLRKKILKLPQHLPDSRSGALTDRYLLHYYFEIFQDGHRRYSPLYTEEVFTGMETQPVPQPRVPKEEASFALPSIPTDVKESKE
jgi:hypothetical protein